MWWSKRWSNPSPWLPIHTHTHSHKHTYLIDLHWWEGVVNAVWAAATDQQLTKSVADAVSCIAWPHLESGSRPTGKTTTSRCLKWAIPPGTDENLTSTWEYHTLKSHWPHKRVCACVCVCAGDPCSFFFSSSIFLFPLVSHFLISSCSVYLSLSLSLSWQRWNQCNRLLHHSSLLTDAFFFCSCRWLGFCCCCCFDYGFLSSHDIGCGSPPRHRTHCGTARADLAPCPSSFYFILIIIFFFLVPSSSVPLDLWVSFLYACWCVWERESVNECESKSTRLHGGDGSWHKESLWLCCYKSLLKKNQHVTQ